jgi:hypothetical protein
MTPLPYMAMTADVGEVGAKRMELREESKWIRSRLEDASGEPRHYDKVKIYGGVPYLSESAPWTIFECLGHNKAGTADELYRYEVPPTPLFGGMKIELKGIVREIHLGKVVERYIPSSQQVTVVSGRGSSNKSRGGREHSTSRAAQEQGGLSAKALERAIAEGVAKEMDRLKKKLKPEPVTAAAQPPQPAVDMQDLFLNRSLLST